MKKIKQIILKCFILFFCMFCLGGTVITPIALKESPTYVCSTVCQASALPKLSEVFKKLFKKDSSEEIKSEKVYVYLGGFPLGFTISCSGVVVVAISNEDSGDLKEGDIIVKIEGEEVSSADQILALINTEKFKGKELSVSYVRGSEEKKTKIKPIFDSTLQIYKLGLWIRDNSAGVGTLTYIRKDNGRFGALGHPVCDVDTGSLIPAKDGNIFRCNIVGYKKGTKGSAGELKGLFLRNGSILGNLDLNNEFGVYGDFDQSFIEIYGGELVEVASPSEVRCGKAYIRCTIDGTTPKDYEIEIVKTYFQTTKANRSMFIRVTDTELLSKTGGIVQGMSGSPIIQNGKLVGAVTHVFISDPSKGYGIYAEWMINN